jgi:hypothetical protein
MDMDVSSDIGDMLKQHTLVPMSESWAPQEQVQEYQVDQVEMSSSHSFSYLVSTSPSFWSGQPRRSFSLMGCVQSPMALWTC